MGFIGWIILGLIAGAIAKAIKPGEQGGGWLATDYGSLIGYHFCSLFGTHLAARRVLNRSFG